MPICLFTNGPSVFTPEQQSWVVMTETARPTVLELSTICPFTENVS